LKNEQILNIIYTHPLMNAYSNMFSLVINTINTIQIGPPGVNGRAENIASSLAHTGILCQFENRKNKEANHIMIRNINIFLSKEIPYASGSIVLSC